MNTFLLVALLAFGAGFIFSDNSAEKRIISGRKTSAARWPMLVSIRDKDLQTTLDWMHVPYKSENGHFCGGTLINKLWVVTAASCFPDKEVQKLMYEGNFNRAKAIKLFRLMLTLSSRKNLRNLYVCLNEECSIKRGVAKLVIHPHYMISLGKNKPGFDIALVKLDKPIYDVAFHEIIPNLKEMGATKQGKDCVTAGWGINDVNEMENSFTLSEYDVELVSPRKCFPFIKKFEYCGEGIPYKGRKTDFCFFDTGGPLLCREDNSDPEAPLKLFGLISRGTSPFCNSRNSRGIYTGLTWYSSWINFVILTNSRVQSTN